MLKTHFWMVLLVLVLGAGCSTVRVSQDYEPGIDYAGFATYAWQHDSQPKTDDIRVDDPLIHQRIRTAIDNNLESRYTKADRAVADFLVGYELAIRQKIKSEGSQGGLMIGSGGRGSFGGIGISTGSPVETYDQGTLFIDVLEPKSGKLLWRGKGTDVVAEHADPEAITRQVNELVQKILAKFPP
jgi:hypothetical protein